jgi:sulfur carrier protein
MIEVKVNQEVQQIVENTDLYQLMSDLKINSNGIAVAVNQKIIRKAEWHEHILCAHDAVLIIKATQGG